MSILPASSAAIKKCSWHGIEFLQIYKIQLLSSKMPKTALYIIYIKIAVCYPQHTYVEVCEVSVNARAARADSKVNTRRYYIIHIYYMTIDTASDTRALRLILQWDNILMILKLTVQAPRAPRVAWRVENRHQCRSNARCALDPPRSFEGSRSSWPSARLIQYQCTVQGKLI